MDPEQILKRLSIATLRDIVPGKTLLFLDEIQECPQALQALRYFKEKMPELHVIGAGSLLEFTLNDENFRMPVGRIQSLYVHPVSFKEYLNASSHEKISNYLAEVNINQGIDPLLHDLLIEKLQEYFLLGGMPEVMQYYLEHKSFNDCQMLQSSILNTYRNDFGKYAPYAKHKYLQALFDKAPGLIAKHFRYVDVNPDMHPRDIKMALEALKDSLCNKDKH